MTVHKCKIKPAACWFYSVPFLSGGFAIMVAMAAGLLCGAIAQGRLVNLGVSQEFGHEQRLRTKDRFGDDAYAKTSIGASLGHPVVFRQGRLIFDPSLSVSYINYFRFHTFDTYGFELYGPLRFELPHGGQRGRMQPHSLDVAGNLSRELVTISTRTGERGVRTRLGVECLYTRHLRFARWRLESGYGYRRTLFDESEYDYRERDENILSLAMLYALSRKLDVGLGSKYKTENFLEFSVRDAATTEFFTQARWRLTGRLEGRGEVGYERVSYRNIDATESGMTLRGALDWRPTERWQYLAELRHEFDITAAAGRTRQVNTTRASLGVGRRLTRRLQVGLTPGFRREGGDPRVTEYDIGLSGKYDFRKFDLTAQAGVTDRRSGAGGDDEYTAGRALVRFDYEF